MRVKTIHVAWGLVGIVIAIVMLPNIVGLCIARNAITLLSSIFVQGLLIALLLAIFGRRIWIANLLLIPTAALACAETFYIERFRHPSDEQVLATIFATTPREIREFLGASLFPFSACLLIAGAIAIFSTFYSWRARLGWVTRSRAWLVLIGIGTPLTSIAIAFASNTGTVKARQRDAAIMMSSLQEIVTSGYPAAVIQNIVDYRRELADMRADAAKIEAFDFHAKRVSQIPQRQVYVLVIGESARRDHWQLFGYLRPTNPELSRVTNLVRMSDLITSWPETIMAVPVLLTRKPPEDKSLNWREPSILAAMAQGGFNTYWISNQMAIGQFDSPVSLYAYEANHIEFLNFGGWTAPGDYDGDLLGALNEAIRNSNGDVFIVLHMMGSHGRYDFRYPAEFKFFAPTTSDEGTPASQFERINNSYDNTIRYTDHVLSQVIATLRNSHSVTAMLYESDHGEDLPNKDCSLSDHGNGTIHDFQIPGLFWYSDEYAKAFPQRVAAFAANAQKRLLSADTFNSLLDMTGITVVDYNPTRSFFNSQWRYRSRVVNSQWSVDFDNAKLDKRCELLMPPNGN